MALALMFTVTVIWYVFTPAIKLGIDIFSEAFEDSYLYSLFWIVWNAVVVIWNLLVLLWAITSMGKEDTESGWT